MSVVIGCYNCAETEGGPICDGCWRQIKKEKERCEHHKIEYNMNVSQGAHGVEAQLYCDIPDCWNFIKKKKAAAGDTRCYMHINTVTKTPPWRVPCRDRTRSPARRRSDAATASSSGARISAAIADARAYLEKMWEAIDEIDDARQHQQFQ